MNERKIALAASLHRNRRHSPKEICATLHISKTTFFASDAWLEGLENQT